MPRVARTTPVLKSNAVDTRDLQVGQEQVATMASTGPAELKHSDIEIIDKPPAKSKLDDLAFMEEKLRVVVHGKEDAQSEQFTQVWNGGQPFVFPHNIEVTCARKFVEVLARSKRRTFKNVEYTDSEGVRAFKYPSQQVHGHPFAVIEDSPKGKEWLRKILQEAA
jgi:hypothetical protein